MDKPQYTYEKITVGRLWPNDNKASDKDPDFQGNMIAVKDLDAVDGDYKKVPEEKKMAVSAWKNRDKDGNIYLSFSGSKKTPKDQKDDDLPF